MSSAAEPLCVSEAAYLARESARSPEDHRSEYVDGVIVAMTGSSKAHNRIAFNLASRLVPSMLAASARGALWQFVRPIPKIVARPGIKLVIADGTGAVVLLSPSVRPRIADKCGEEIFFRRKTIY